MFSEDHKDPELVNKEYVAEDFLYTISKPQMKGKVKSVDMHMESEDSVHVCEYL